jgi:selenocysteine-specific elongation factor
MRRLTLGTAGHIDHGKTKLVEALTGTDTDRLPEEQRRGISIVLGYADLELPDGTHLSVVDVPGHERFVRTMVAGSTGIDLYLLVVDAREGPKPQTLEHLRILRLLGVEAGVVAISKIDAADAEQVEATREAVARLVPETEIVLVSALGRVGLDLLLAALSRAAAGVASRSPAGPARLYVDRSFSLAGVGPVVTGTLWSGSISAGDRLEALPAGLEVRVRSVQVHGETVEQAEAGRRVALAVSAERRRRPAVGDALVAPGSFTPTYRLDVALDGPDGLAPAARVTVCHGTSAVPARFRRVGERFAQLRLERPLVVAPGDRIVLRQETTVGGGRVIDVAPPRRLDADRLGHVEQGELASLVEAPVELASVARRFQLGDEELATALNGVVRAGPYVLSPAWLASTREAAEAALEAREGELDPGLPLSALLPREPWAADVARLLDLDEDEGKLYLPGRRPSSGARGEQLADADGLEPFAVEDAALARQLEREGRLVALGGGLALTPSAYEHHKAIVVAECKEAGTISLARFRDLSGLSRRTAQLVLERFDSDRVTLRVGDVRRLRRSRGGSG